MSIDISNIDNTYSKKKIEHVIVNMPEDSSATNMCDNDPFGSNDLAIRKKQSRSTSPTHSVGILDKTYRTLPEHATAKSRFQY